MSLYRKTDELKNEDFFKFESKKEDFPYYKKFKLPIIVWVFLASFWALTFPISYFGEIFVIIFAIFFGFISSILIFKWDYKIVFRKIKKEDIMLILLILLLKLIYTFIMSYLINVFGFSGGNGYTVDDLTLFFWISFPFAMLYEELFKIFLFLATLSVSYKISKNRKRSILISVIINCFCFALIHYFTYLNIVSILVLQGVGNVFYMFAYIKTKNLWVTYIIHALFNLFIFGNLIFGI